MKTRNIVAYLISLTLILFIVNTWFKVRKENAFVFWVESNGGSLGKVYPSWVKALPSFLDFYKEICVISYGVNLANSKIVDISSLNGNLKVTSLDLSNTAITNFTTIGTLKNVEVLRLDGLPIQDLSQFSPLKKLVALNISNLGWKNSSFSNDGSYRTTLFQRHPPIKNIEPLKDLKNLEYLSLNGSDLSAIKTLVLFKNLKFVSLMYTKLTPDQIVSLQETLPNCKIVFKDDGIMRYQE